MGYISRVSYFLSAKKAIFVTIIEVH